MGAARPTRVRLRHFSHQSPGVLDQYQVCSSSAFDRRGLGSCSPLQDVHATQAASRWTTWRQPNEAVTSSQKSTTSGTLDASASQRSRRRKLNRRTQWSSSCSALARSRHRRADIGIGAYKHSFVTLIHTHLLRDQKMNYVRQKK